jgi:hypothetical protein
MYTLNVAGGKDLGALTRPPRIVEGIEMHSSHTLGAAAFQSGVGRRMQCPLAAVNKSLHL